MWTDASLDPVQTVIGLAITAAAPVPVQARTDMVHITPRTVSSWYCLFPVLSSGLISRFLVCARRSIVTAKMLRFLLLVAMSLHTTTANETSAYMMQTTAIYSDETCSGPSRNVLVISNDDCAAQACSPRAFGNNTDYYQTVTCFSTDSFSYDPMEDLFLGKTFIEGQVYNNTTCSDDSYWFRLGLIVGGCEPFTTTYNNSVTATLSSDGSASMLLYNNTECTDPPMTTYALGNTTLAKHLCYEGISNTGLKQHIARYFIHHDYDTGSSGSDTKAANSGTSSHTTVSIVSGIVAAFVVILAIAAVVISRKHKKKMKHHQMDETLAVMETRFTTTEAMFYRPGKVDFNASSQSTMPSDRSWDDDIIVAARIPRDKVILETLVSRGAFGEVYKGTYNGQLIAAKMLLVDTRRSIPHVNAFMAEVKMSAVMDHPRIAKFIGVAWDSLSDLCSVTEFMEGGDLKALLAKYEEEGHPLGFNYTKVKIALHVAHALTYLHSLDPPVIHRDLKSRNILLSKELEAKLTDFGISRERIDATMTAGVGTSLWMAPEIMMGNQYDEMADMFSFGVVLSELSTHAAPYSHARLRSSSQQPMPRTVILQNVAAGKLSVDFSDAGPDPMVELGRACVAMDPRERPTAAEALYRLHKVLTLEFRVE